MEGVQDRRLPRRRDASREFRVLAARAGQSLIREAPVIEMFARLPEYDPANQEAERAPARRDVRPGGLPAPGCPQSRRVGLYYLHRQ